TFSKFVDMWNPRNSRHPTTVLKVFTTTYGDDVALKMFLENANSPVATKLKNEMVKNWEVALEHPANVFTLLELDKAGDNLFSSPLLKTWVQYLKTFNEESKYGKTTMIKTFSTSYGDEKLATMLEAAKKVPDTEQFAKNLQAAQFNQWMVEKKTPKDMLSILKLKTEDLHFFNEKNPMVDVWRAYNKAYGTKVDTSFAFQP
ncbi:Avirulence (Avh) protein, partial [Phytophthora megakarya]